jgi:hypothetical protein
MSSATGHRGVCDGVVDLAYRPGRDHVRSSLSAMTWPFRVVCIVRILSDQRVPASRQLYFAYAYAQMTLCPASHDSVSCLLSLCLKGFDAVGNRDPALCALHPDEVAWAEPTCVIESAGFEGKHLRCGLLWRRARFRRSIAWPARTPVNASRTPSRTAAQDSGRMWLVRPSSRWTFTIYLPPVSPAHTYPLRDTFARAVSLQRAVTFSIKGQQVLLSRLRLSFRGHRARS